MIKIIGEIGINHNGSVEIAKALIDIAKECGFDYVKFQKRFPEDCIPKVKWQNKRYTWWGELSYIRYKNKIEFNYAEYKEIDRYCKEIGINKWFASVWDLKSARFICDEMGQDTVKIPSALLTSYELGRWCRAHFNKLILSTGMSTEKEIEIAIKEYDPDVIMHTNSTYPAPVDELNLNYIKWLQNKYPDKEIGYSSHYYGLIDCYVAAGLGAKWIEKHITLYQDMWGSDQKSSVSPEGMKKLVKGIKDTEKAMGKIKARELLESEKRKLKDLRKL